ncbi:MAG: FtsL-like putative cell division protein [Saprospiraceae bacterium]
MKLKKYSIYSLVINNANFIGIWILFGLFYISNVHKAEKKLRKMNTVQKEIDDVRRTYIHIKDKTLFSGTQYEIVKNVEGMNIEKEVKIPKKIIKP